MNVLYSIISLAKLSTLRLELFCKLFVCIRNNNGLNTEPVVPQFHFFSQFESYHPKQTNCFLPSTYEQNRRCKFPLHHIIPISFVRFFYLHYQKLYLNLNRLHKLHFLFKNWTELPQQILKNLKLWNDRILKETDNYLKLKKTV